MAIEFGYEIDTLDLRLLRRLATDGRATWADLAVETDMTAPGVAQRVRRLRERGILRGFAALIAPEAVAPICAFVSIALDGSRDHAAFRTAMQGMPEVQECHHVAGADSYLMTVVARDLADLERFLASVNSYGETRTSIVFSTPIPRRGLVPPGRAR